MLQITLVSGFIDDWQRSSLQKRLVVPTKESAYMNNLDSFPQP